MADASATPLATATQWPTPAPDAERETARFDAWRTDVRQRALSNVAEFIAARRGGELALAGSDKAGEILLEFVSGGKCLRSTFLYLGWLCDAAPSPAALWAASSLELLHAFALLQDDVMDESTQRRGRPAAHIQFADWHRDVGLAGSSRRFGESAATLLADLCLVWSEQMLRECGLEHACLRRVWPRYDAMRTELAVGQLADLTSDIRDAPPFETVLDVARRKSGNYTVRRPLEIGAAMAGCGETTLVALGRYGTAVGEAFQLRDDVIGVFGSPAATGKPAGGDLAERKATSIVVAAYHMADAAIRRELAELMDSADLDDDAIERCKELITATGAPESIEADISARISVAHDHLDAITVDEFVRNALAQMAAFCTRHPLEKRHPLANQATSGTFR